jgi:prevent-host-death family protein
MCYIVYTMDERIGVRALRQRASEVLSRVKEGDVVTVTDRGRPVARLVPLGGGALEQLVLEGRATSAEGDLLAMVDQLGLPESPAGGRRPTEALAELRADER